VIFGSEELESSLFLLSLYVDVIKIFRKHLLVFADKEMRKNLLL